MHCSATQAQVPFRQSQGRNDHGTHLPRKPTGNWSTQMPSPDYPDKNKQIFFCTTNPDLFHLLSLESEEQGRNKQVALDLSKELCKQRIP